MTPYPPKQILAAKVYFLRLSLDPGREEPQLLNYAHLHEPINNGNSHVHGLLQ